MIARLGELERIVANLIKPGKVIAGRYGSPPRVQVQIGLNTTGWIPFLGSRAGGNRSWAPPEAGEQVLVLSHNGDHAQGYAIPGLYQNSALAPFDSPDIAGEVFKDGAVIKYDRAAHALTADLTASGSATITTGAASLTQTATAVTLKINGTSLSVKDGSITLTIGGCTITFDATGAKVTGGNVTADSIDLKNHIHPDPQGGSTSAPVG